MDNVVLDGIEYVKASAIAKQFHYTSDYVGQLCRAKKVDARLVGRTWFVRPGSIKEHKNTTHNKVTEPAQKPAEQSVKTKAVDDDSASNVKIHRIEVNAPLKNKTAKSAAPTQSVSPVSTHSASESTPTISYHQDAETLLPNLNLGDKTKESLEKNTHASSSVKKYLHIEPASAKKLKITGNNKKHASFSSTELPDVALSGKLSVSEYTNSFNTPPDTPNAKETVAPKTQETKSIDDSHVSVRIEHDAQRQSAVEEEPPESDTPAAEAPVVEPAPPASLWVRIMPLLVTFLAIIISAALLSLVSEITISSEVSTSNISFQTKQFLQLFTQ